MEGGPNIQERDSTNLLSESEDEDETKGCFNFFCHPRRGGHRFIALIFMCFLGFGSYFCYDNPAALQNYIKKDLNLTTPEYTMWFFNRQGVWHSSRHKSVHGNNAIRSIRFALGVYCNQYWLMLFGRFIFGIGGESLAVAQNNYAVLWFKGKELNMVFGLQLSFARVGSTVNFIVMESIYNWIHEAHTGPQGLGIVLFIATLTCVLSMLCALILGCFDKRAERILRRNEESLGDVVRLRDVKDFKATFWLVTVICVAYYVAIFPFISLAKDFFIEKFKMSNQAANNISSTVYAISGFASPLLGLFIDKTGKNITWIVVAISGTIGSHILLAFTTLNPYVAMGIMGVAYATLASSLWPLVSLIIPEYQLGTAL
ncbi:hypothetical protein NQ315_005500 [Exocentrus adspersus]|uniref:Lysosomal dipeptide transporter MFSD1 n=1 Tax=Exocentrus adspersus TaxID=1586481 RepID=A0AAV8VT56_9CUCU|nr:hypothetical protein NQ315_005500 [Exocentrus adspersus]